MNLILTTERLVLRPYVQADAGPIETLANNWNVASRLGRMPFPYVAGMAAAFMADHDRKRAARTSFPFAITFDETFVGGIGLDRETQPDWELGYWIAEPFWGQGLATEAAEAVVEFGFTDLALSRIVAGHFCDNPASGRVLAKLGFRYTGNAVRPCLARGGEVESREMALERADWTGR